MSTNPQYGRTGTPINLLEPIEIDFMARQSFDPSKYGRTETPINLLEPIEIDFAVPHLVLTLRMPEDAGAVDPDSLAVDVYDLILALGDYEAAIGGRGLRLQNKRFDAATITLTLVPILRDQSRERMDRVADLVKELNSNRDRNGSESGSLSEAFDRAMSSPEERCKIGLARRPWQVEAKAA